VTTTPFDRLADAWASGDADQVSSLFHPEATWVIDGQCIAGDEIPLVIEATLNGLKGARILIRRAFHDSFEPDWWVAEWTFRITDDGATWREIEQGLLLHLRDGLVDSLRTHNDHRSIRAVQPDDPLREEAWPAEMPEQTRPMTREEVIAAHTRHVMQGWAQGNGDVVASSHGPAGIIQTSFEVVRGHDQLRKSVNAYFENYADTSIEVHRMVYDGHFLAINQTWRCTNRKTGVVAGDQDLNIGIMRDGKFYRWREYYDSRTSAQTLEQTVFGRPEQ
jgi:ketosteroid isomerase-like protein